MTDVTGFLLAHTAWNYLYVIVVACALVLAGGFGVYAFRHRTVPGSGAFSFLMLSCIVWGGASLVTMVSPTPDAAAFWHLKIHFLGVATVPVGYCLFACSYTGTWKRWSAKRMWVLFLIPLLTIPQ